MKLTFDILARFRDSGLAAAEKRSKRYADNFERAEEAQRRAQRTMEKAGVIRDVSEGKTRGGGGRAPSGLDTYRTQRSAIGTRGADARNFSGLAQGAGQGSGIVAAYATLASTLFAVTAAFQALSQAARVEQLTEGLEILGARGGTSLKSTAQGLRQVTDNAISTAEAMKAVASASSAGLGSEEINRLGKVARGASLALGRNLGESMDRLTRGAIKLEPELLDELGIMVRLDEAVKQYALENNKVASSLSLTERRQAFLNAVLEEGERKFGDIADNAGTNPYDRLQASLQDMGTAMLTIANGPLKIIAGLLTEMPALALLPLMGVLEKASSAIFPTFGSTVQNTTEKLDQHFLALGRVANRVEEELGEVEYSVKIRQDLIGNEMFQEAMDARGVDVSRLKPNESVSLGLQKQIEHALKAEIELFEAIEARGELLTDSEQEYLKVIKSQQYAIAQTEAGLAAINNRHVDNLDIQSRTLILLERRNDIIAGYYQSVEEGANPLKQAFASSKELFDNVSKQRKLLEGEMLGEKGTATLTQRFKLARFSIVQNMRAAYDSVKLFGNVILRIIPFIGQAVMAFQVLTGSVNFLKSKEQKTFETARKELRTLAEESEKVGVEIDKAFKQRDYATGIEAAIKNINELIAKFSELAEARANVKGFFRSFTEDLQTFIGNDFAGKLEDFGRNVAENFVKGLLVPGMMGIEVDFSRKGQRLEGVSAAESKALNQIVSRVGAISEEMGVDLYKSILQAVDEGRNLEEVVKSATARVTELEGAWNSVGEAAKKAGEAVKKFYGPTFLETTYSDVADGIKEISTQFNNIADANLELTSTVAATDRLLKGGTDLAAELDTLAGGGAFFRAAFDNINTLEARISVLRKQGKDETDRELKDLIALANAAKSELADAYRDGNFETLAQIKNTEQFIREKTLEAAKAAEGLAKVEKQISSELAKQEKLQREITNLITYGSKKAPSKGLELQAQIEALESKIRVEENIIAARRAVIDAEYQLANYKLEIEQARLRTIPQQSTAVAQQTALEDFRSANLQLTIMRRDRSPGDPLSATDEQIQAQEDKVNELRNRLTSLRTGAIGAEVLELVAGKTFENFEQFATAINMAGEEQKDLARTLYSTFLVSENLNRVQETSNALRQGQNALLDQGVATLNLQLDSLRTEQQLLGEERAVNERARELEKQSIEQAKRRLQFDRERLKTAQTIRDIESDIRHIQNRTGAGPDEIFSNRAAEARRAYIDAMADINIEQRTLNNSLEEELVAQSDLKTALDAATASRDALSESDDNYKGEAAAVSELTDKYNLQTSKVNDLRVQLQRLGIEGSDALALLTAQMRLFNAEREQAQLSTIISNQMQDAQGRLGLSRATFGVGLAGASEEFSGLVQEYLSKNKNKTVLDLLGDEEALKGIRRASVEMRLLNIQATGLDNIANTAASSFADVFTQVVQGSMNGKEAFKQMALSILEQINQMIVQMLVLQSLMPFFKGGSGIQNTNVAMDPNAVSLMGPTTVINQGAFNPAPISVPGLAMGGIMKYASGGVMPANSIAGTVTSPTYLVGEGKYNEAVVPLPNGKHIPVQMHGSSGETNDVVNVNVSDTGTTSTQEGMDPAKLGQAISNAVQRELMAQKSPGGLLSKYG